MKRIYLKKKQNIRKYKSRDYLNNHTNSLTSVSKYMSKFHVRQNIFQYPIAIPDRARHFLLFLLIQPSIVSYQPHHDSRANPFKEIAVARP